MHTAPEVYLSRPDTERALWAMTLHGRADCNHDRRYRALFAAASGAALRDLMARMGHDSERAALIYQHEARGADTAITNAIDAHVDAERSRRADDDGGESGTLIPAG